MLDQPSSQELHNIANGDYHDNCEVDTACARRLLLLCRDYGEDGQEAEKLLQIAFRKIDVYA
jgi:hypothetical protein